MASLRSKLSRKPDPIGPEPMRASEKMGPASIPRARRKPIVAPEAPQVYYPPAPTPRTISMADLLDEEVAAVQPRIKKKRNINWYWVIQLILSAMGVAFLAMLVIKK